jgi:hypothetical protein
VADSVPVRRRTEYRRISLRQARQTDGLTQSILMLPLVQIKVGETAAKKRRKYRENNRLSRNTV